MMVKGSELNVGDTFTVNGGKQYTIKAFRPYSNAIAPELECDGSTRCADFHNVKLGMTIHGETLYRLVSKAA